MQNHHLAETRFILNYTNIRRAAIVYAYAICNSVVFLTIIVTYFYITRQLCITIPKGVKSETSKRKYNKINCLIMPTLLIITYLGFVLVPDFTGYMRYNGNMPKGVINTMLLLNNIGYASDAIIYSLFSTSIRYQISNLMKFCCSQPVVEKSKETSTIETNN